MPYSLTEEKTDQSIPTSTRPVAMTEQMRAIIFGWMSLLAGMKRGCLSLSDLDRTGTLMDDITLVMAALNGEKAGGDATE